MHDLSHDAIAKSPSPGPEPDQLKPIFGNGRCHGQGKKDQKRLGWSESVGLVATKNGGAEGSRTPDLLIANETLYQLSYDPTASAAASLGRALPLRQVRFPSKPTPLI